jgi:hypothetical protein
MKRDCKYATTVTTPMHNYSMQKPLIQQLYPLLIYPPHPPPPLPARVRRLSAATTVAAPKGAEGATQAWLLLDVQLLLELELRGARWGLVVTQEALVVVLLGGWVAGAGGRAQRAGGAGGVVGEVQAGTHHLIQDPVRHHPRQLVLAMGVGVEASAHAQQARWVEGGVDGLAAGPGQASQAGWGPRVTHPGAPVKTLGQPREGGGPQAHAWHGAAAAVEG